MSHYSNYSKRSKAALKSRVGGSLNGILVSKCPRQQGLRQSSSSGALSAGRLINQGASKKRKVAPIFNTSSSTQDTSGSQLHHQANRLVFGNSSFREKQEEVVKAVLANRDVLVLFPTGGGKSLCYQLPAVISKGITVVISPLISLIHDQHRSLIERDIPSTFINSQQSKAVTRDILDHITSPQPLLKVLYTTPETLVNSTAFRSALTACHRNGMLARIAVDECHCVSSWGHDFRPDYRHIGRIRAHYPGVPIVALTATASDATVKDILRSLKMTRPVIIKKSFNRSNLRYTILPKPAEKQALELVAARIKKYPQGTTGIVYCLSQNDTVKVAAFLKLKGLRCDYYHAGMTTSERDLVQAGWSTGRLHVVCATIAYGMGIDKSDVRYVIHFCAPKSIEGYFQESGRYVIILHESYSDQAHQPSIEPGAMASLLTVCSTIGMNINVYLRIHLLSLTTL